LIKKFGLHYSAKFLEPSNVKLSSKEMPFSAYYCMTKTRFIRGEKKATSEFRDRIEQRIGMIEGVLSQYTLLIPTFHSGFVVLTISCSSSLGRRRSRERAVERVGWSEEAVTVPDSGGGSVTSTSGRVSSFVGESQGSNVGVSILRVT